MGVEWEDPTAGRHDGSVDGIRYFSSELHTHLPEYAEGTLKSCSFLREGKVVIGGSTLREAILDKYRPEELMTEEERKRLEKTESEEIYVNTDKKGMKKIEVLG